MYMYMLGTNAVKGVLHTDGYTRLWILCSNKVNQISDFILTIKLVTSMIKFISLDISNKIIWLYLLALYFFLKYMYRFSWWKVKVQENLILIVFLAYIPPTPPKPEPGTTNPHRYMFYLLEQTDEPDTSLVNQEWRGKFRLDDFVINNGCQIVASFQYTTSFWINSQLKKMCFLVE